MSKVFSFIQGVMLDRDHLYLSAVVDELEDADYRHGIIIESTEQGWSNSSLEYRIAGISCYKNQSGHYLVTVGEDGIIESTDSEGIGEDTITGKNELPSRHRPLYGVKRIGQWLFVCGSYLQVYARSLESFEWHEVDEGCRAPVGGENPSAFFDIDGLDGDTPLLMAAGSNGSIWLKIGNGEFSWTEVKHGLTTSNLHVVQHLTDRNFLIAGEQGTIMLVDMLDVAIVDHDITRETFCGAAVAFGSVYLSTDQGNLFVMTDGTLSAVELPFPGNQGGSSLCYADGQLLFVTYDSVALFDGRTWEVLNPTER